MALTAKQKAFVQEYLIDLNATQAAIRAGYSAKTARKIGQENLTKPDIQKAIQEAMDARAKRTEITADRVLQELAKIGFANITDYLRVSTSERVVERNTVTDAEGNETIVPIFDMVQSVELFDTDGIDRVKMDAVAEICE
ncbi:terminase small subunit, partial [Paenibacillus dendritiformis]